MVPNPSASSHISAAVEGRLAEIHLVITVGRRGNFTNGWKYSMEVGLNVLAFLRGGGIRLTRFEFKKQIDGQIGLTEELAVMKLHVK
jgi:hypothetical protein